MSSGPGSAAKPGPNHPPNVGDGENQRNESNWIGEIVERKKQERESGDSIQFPAVRGNAAVHRNCGDSHPDQIGC